MWRDGAIGGQHVQCQSGGAAIALQLIDDPNLAPNVPIAQRKVAFCLGQVFPNDAQVPPIADAPSASALIRFTDGQVRIPD